MEKMNKTLEKEIEFCKYMEAEKNEHGQFIYTSSNGASSFNLPHILQEYKEWLIDEKVIKKL